MISAFCSRWRLLQMTLQHAGWARHCHGHGLLPPPERVFARGGEGWGGGRFLAQAAPRPLPTARKCSREEGSHPRPGLFAVCCTVVVASLGSTAFAQTPPPTPQPRVTIGYDVIA